MLHTFNPNLKVISRSKDMSTHWKVLQKKKKSDFLYVSKSDYPSMKGDGTGATIAAKRTSDNLPFLFDTPPVEVTFATVNGDFAPLHTGKFATANVNDPNARRILEIRLGSITDRLKDYLKSKGRSEQGIEKMIADQLAYKDWQEDMIEHIATEAAKMVTGKERTETTRFLKEKKITEGVLHVLYKNSNAKDKIDNLVYSMKQKKIAKKNDYFKISAKSRVLSNKKYPVYPIIKDHRVRDDVINMVPPQEILDQIYVRSEDGNVEYHGFDAGADGERLDKPIIRSGDLVKMVYRPKFYKDSSGIGFTNELREIHLLERPLASSLGKRQAESQLNPEDTHKELDEYF